MPFMISQIKIVSISSGYSAFSVADITIPPDKINGIIKIIPVRAAVSSNPAVLTPGLILCL